MQSPGNHIAIAIGLVIKPAVEARQQRADTFLGCGVVSDRVAPIGRQHGVQRERNAQTHQHRAGHRQRKGAKPLARDTRHKGHGNENSDDGKGGGRNSQTNFGRAFQRRGAPVRAALHMAHNVFPHHDGIVDQHTNGQGEPQQGHEIEREAAQPDRNEGGNDGSGQAQRGDQGGTPGVQKGVHHEDCQNGTQHQGFDDVVQAVLRIYTTVTGDVEFGSRVVFFELEIDFLDQLAHLVGHTHGAGVTRAGHKNADIGLTAPNTERVNVGEAVRDAGNLRQADDLAVEALDHNVLEFFGRLDATHQPDALFFELAAHFTHRGVRVLCPQRRDHFAHRYVVFTQLRRAQQHRQFALQRAIDIDRGHAGDAAQFVRQHVFGQARDFGVALRAGRQCQIHDWLRSRVKASNDGFAHFDG